MNKALTVFLFFICFAFSEERTFGQRANLPLTASIPRIFLINGFDENVKDFTHNNGVGSVKLINGSYIYNKNSYSLTSNNLKKKIRQLFPDSLEAGICVLDWEAPGLPILMRKKPDDPEYQKVLKGYIEAITLAKKMRPNVDWGFYGIPFNEYWNRNKQWRDNCAKIVPLLKQCDIFCPALYEPFKAGQRYPGDDSVYVVENMKEMLQLAAQLDKKVLPFVWYRYHPSNKVIGLNLIPQSEFEQHVRLILSTNYKGLIADGLIVYEMTYNLSNPRIAQTPDLKSFVRLRNNNHRKIPLNSDLNNYRDSIVKVYCKRILKIARSNSQNK